MTDPTPQELDGIARILAETEKIDGARPFRYGFSNAGEPCLRALVYDAQDADAGKPPASKPMKLKHRLTAVCGTAVGSRIEEGARRLGFVTQARHVFETGAIAVHGSSDILARTAVVDIKLVGEKKWKRIQKTPDGKHVLQVNGYAVQADRPRWVLLYVRALSIFADPDDLGGDDDQLQIKVHAGDASIDLAQDLCGVWEQVDQHRKLRTLPERVWGADPDKFPCHWCSHLERCNPQKEET